MPVLLPAGDSCSAARRTVTDVLTEIDRGDLVDDAAIIVSELVTNAVLHAGSQVHLSVFPHDGGVRIEVADVSSHLPRWSPVEDGATSGRGLILVNQLSSRWGAERTADGGKLVWAELVETAAPVDEITMEDLLAKWADDACSPAPATVAVRLDIDVRRMLESRSHTDDLHRELQLVRLWAATATAKPSERERRVLRLATQLTAASDDFRDARQQMWSQTLGAARRSHDRATLQLALLATDAEPAAAWLAALDEADALAADGQLLLPAFPHAMTEFRRQYIGDIIAQLNAADPPV
jgi:anti-sigma regulatory factor (Ser/Thr protein kinase)